MLVVVVVGLAVEEDMDNEGEGKGHVLGSRGARGVKGCEYGGAWIWNIFLLWYNRWWRAVGEEAGRTLMLMGKAEREVRRVERVLLVAKIQCKSLYSNGR